VLEEKGMFAGRFYRRKDTGQLVFAASTNAYPSRSPIKINAYNEPDDKTPVVAIGGDQSGYSLKGYFGRPAHYEEVDVEIVVKRR
jgi:hypothetical protein